MQSDLPHTLYLKDKTKGGGNHKVSKNDRAFSKQEEAIRKAQERRKARKKDDAPYTMDELFKQ